MNISFIFNGGVSKRYHTVDTLKSQDIAAHSFGVAWLCEVLTDGKASKELIMAALAHDLAEHIVGDLPSPSKRALGQHFMNAFDIRENHELLANGVGHYEYRLTKLEARALKMAPNMTGEAPVCRKWNRIKGQLSER